MQFTDFTVEGNRKAFEDVLTKVEDYLGQNYDLIIGGDRISTESKIVSVNQANKEQVIVRVSKCSQELAEKAMQIADRTFHSWRKSKPEMRADILFRAAAIVRRRKHEFSALLVKEVGKPWNEADCLINKTTIIREPKGLYKLHGVCQ